MLAPFQYTLPSCVLSYPASLQARQSAVQLSLLPHPPWPATPEQPRSGQAENPQAAGPMCFLNEDEEVWTHCM